MKKSLLAILSKNTMKLSTGDGKHSPLIKLQQVPPKIILILTAHHQMKRVIWNFNFMVNYICLKKKLLFKTFIAALFPADKENLCCACEDVRPFSVGENQFKF